jgi:hypothetical protein
MSFNCRGDAMTFNSRATALVWFQSANYARLVSLCDDGGIAAYGSYESWLYAAECRKQSLENKGQRVLCVDLCPDEFPRWCRARGMKLDATGRKAYTAYIASKLLYSHEAPNTLQ